MVPLCAVSLSPKVGQFSVHRLIVTAWTTVILRLSSKCLILEWLLLYLKAATIAASVLIRMQRLLTILLMWYLETFWTWLGTTLTYNSYMHNSINRTEDKTINTQLTANLYTKLHYHVNAINKQITRFD